MKKIHISFIFLYILVIVGCSSISSSNKYTKSQDELPIQYKIFVRTVDVEDNYVENKDIENQVFQNLETMYFESQKKISGKKNNNEIPEKQLFLDVIITQRSFIKNIETYNSVFLNAKLLDSEENVVLQTCLNKETKNTIVSSYEQNALCKYLFKETNNFVLKNFNIKVKDK